MSLVGWNCQFSPDLAVSSSLELRTEHLCLCCRFFYEGELGDTAGGSLVVWAPTAQSMELLHFTECEGGEPEVLAMQRGPQGTWTLPRPAEWDKHYFFLR